MAGFAGMPPTHIHPKVRLFTCLLLALWTGLVHASPEADFRAIREALHKGQGDKVLRLAQRFPANHPLAPYVEYWRLKTSGDGNAERLAFLQRHPDTALVERIHAELARDLAREENWPAFRQQFQALVKPDQELQCYDLRARLATADPGADQASLNLWLSPRELPPTCDVLFAQLVERNLIGLDQRLARLRLTLEAGNLDLAREIVKTMPVDQAWTGSTLAEAQRHGESLIAEAPAPRAMREAALYALGRLADGDPDGTAQFWEVHAAKYSENEQRYGWGQIAMHAARKHHPLALIWFERAGLALSELQAGWKARIALRMGRWVEVYNAIQQLPESSREEPVWRYWKARALRIFHADYQANVLFARLSQEINYYGLLAEEELPERIETRPRQYRVLPDDLRAAENHRGLNRALVLRSLGDAGNAVAEWDWALRGFNDRQILAAAELALREKWHDRAILTAEKTREEHNFDLRYIAPFRDLASTYAHQNGLDEAWVYGLMRQESRFIEEAKSSAGARGLMQIMPATARWIARQLGLDFRAHRKVDQPDTNIRFGTYYLKRIFSSLDNSPVLATAGYNAGPTRARRWQADSALEGAIYVESIPFGETRTYVKKVMANAMYYRLRFGGETKSLKDRLGVIPPRGSQPEASDETSPSPD